jgi:predicted MPP superfamily phosphohydrolase
MKKKRKILITAISLISILSCLLGFYGYIVFPLKGDTDKLSIYGFDKDMPFSDDYGFNVDFADDSYKILFLTDLHYLGIGLYDSTTNKKIKALIESQTPDMIVLLGDQTSSPLNDSVYKNCLTFFDSFKLPWAFVFGNHDDDFHSDKAYLANILKKSEYLLYKDGPDIGGLGNYFVNFMYGNEKVHTLYLMDSDDCGVSLVSKYDWQFKKHRNSIKVDTELLDWYEWAVAGNKTPSTIALHIPLLEYKDAYDYAEQNGGVLRGLRREGNDSYEENIGMFDKIIELGSTKSVIAGHNHKNDFAVSYQGIELMHCVTSGFTTDGVDGVHGGTVCTIDKNGVAQFRNVYYA